MKFVTKVFAVLIAVLIHAGCATLPGVPLEGASHRYFIEIDRPGSVYAVLENPREGGAFLRLMEINDAGRPISDTLQAWVQHYSGRKRFSEEALTADIIIACHRELQPNFAQTRHVLPESNGEIFVYMMHGGVLIVSDRKISFYDVLLAARNAR